MKRLAWVLAGTLVVAAAAHAGGAAASPKDVRPLLIGAAAPNVTVRAVDGAAVDLAELTKKQRTVLVFYRGGW